MQATAEAAALRREVAAARADNVALVERLRFVQGYAQQQRTRKGALALLCSTTSRAKVDREASQEDRSWTNRHRASIAMIWPMAGSHLNECNSDICDREGGILRNSRNSALVTQEHCGCSASRCGGVADAGGSDVERQYAGEYEERVNPFREFIAGERSLRRRQLSAPDRIMYELGQVVSSSRCAQEGNWF